MLPRETSGRLWNDGSEAWEEVFDPQRVPLFEAILDACGVEAGTDVLDAGCGSGGIALRAGIRGAHPAGFDVSDGMVERARAKVPDGDFRVGDLDMVPFDGDGFDIVIACDCLPFADNTVRAIGELGRVCRTGGTVAIAIWEIAETSDYSRLFSAMEATQPVANIYTPLALSETGVLEGLIVEAGLSIRDTRNLPLEYRFAGFDAYWRAARLVGGIANMIGLVGEDTVRHAAHEAVERCVRPSGELVLRNAYHLAMLDPGP